MIEKQSDEKYFSMIESGSERPRREPTGDNVRRPVSRLAAPHGDELQAHKGFSFTLLVCSAFSALICLSCSWMGASIGRRVELVWLVLTFIVPGPQPLPVNQDGVHGVCRFTGDEGNDGLSIGLADENCKKKKK